ncbi:hypothetical protein HYDPIDRAFT_113516 [Hydnomerulius pinastri MD-312]|uniref:NUC153 domain-containing protein n=1 Tax=Hydnomerulius pinastri MD-312 TaxID=994086 RepID=A0A0C9VBG7_9AGAM|nr:hypothetical protein HYDPIDRAFT_113516 [Hydnomerulius pinastri MD-312]
MSDPRFARLKTDPRFRRPKKHQSKVVVDERFKDLLDDGQKGHKKKGKGKAASVDKYGRKVSETHEKDDLRRFYRLEGEDGEEGVDGEEKKSGEGAPGGPSVVDYARGAVLMESSDEEDGEEAQAQVPDEDSDSDTGGFITLGDDPSHSKKSRSKRAPADDAEAEDAEIDLDETTLATLDAQVAAYAKSVPQRDEVPDVQKTRRLAVVNLDWDYVRAVHLYKIVSSLVSPTAPAAPTATASHVHPDRQKAMMARGGNRGANVTRGKILSVRVYPSEFGKKRIAREEKEGPPPEVFKKKKAGAPAREDDDEEQEDEDEEINEKTIYETGTGEDYDEDALRTYQLERLRYYYAIIECDSIEAAAHIYNELEGTELERSANVFDLSFVPDDMTFDDEPRDEATEQPNAPYRAVEFVTDALRHSKVKLTWDEDDAERNHFTRRPLTKKEIEEADFKAYIASSSSSEGESEDESAVKEKGETGGKKDKKSRKAAARDKMRALLLGGNDDELPEGWGGGDAIGSGAEDAFDGKAGKLKRRGGKGTGEGGEEGSDVDMQITFMPGLSEAKNPDDETTLERYQRKMKEKRKKRKEEIKAGAVGPEDETGEAEAGKMKDSGVASLDDEFFGAGSDSESDRGTTSAKQKGKKSKKSRDPVPETTPRQPLTKEELRLLAASDNPHGEPAHFDMKAVVKAEKQNKNKKSRHKSKKRADTDADDGPNEAQGDFVIDVKDDRFAAIHEDHQFAIDPSNPHFKKTKGMAALLDERTKRKKSRNDRPEGPDSQTRGPAKEGGHDRSLQSLVESVKRKSAAADQGGIGKRRKL